MQFDIKRGHGKTLEGDGLKKLMEEKLGPVTVEGDKIVTSFGATIRLEAKLLSRTSLDIVTQSDRNASPEAMEESSKKYNEFMEAATGFTAKQRSKRMQKKVKEGKL
ncbi:MAG: DUF5611 family protein [Euryarchaeota archaeon]|nr:DUF5611 family protein [Euryarchaeota archaeon]